MTAAVAAPSGADLRAWTRWPSIDAAIESAPLDGPDEVLEKAEIIADRRDALQSARPGLQRRCAELSEALSRVEVQLQALQEIILTIVDYSYGPPSVLRS